MSDRKTPEPNRLNRSVAIGEIAGKALDPLLRQRGFATSELIANWASIVPPPYDRGLIPDRLKWPRKAPDAPADGASLFVRVDPAHALGFVHETAQIRDAINRYFGFFLVSEIRTAREPFTPRSAAPPEHTREATPAERLRIETMVASVKDEDLRASLEKLGQGVLARGKQASDPSR